jgi:hypothetical protein
MGPYARADSNLTLHYLIVESSFPPQLQREKSGMGRSFLLVGHISIFANFHNTCFYVHREGESTRKGEEGEERGKYEAWGGSWLMYVIE